MAEKIVSPGYESIWHEAEALRTRVAELEQALTNIVLEGQSSMGGRELMGKMARYALAGKKQ